MAAWWFLLPHSCRVPGLILSLHYSEFLCMFSHGTIHKECTYEYMYPVCIKLSINMSDVCRCLLSICVENHHLVSVPLRIWIACGKLYQFNNLTLSYLCKYVRGAKRELWMPWMDEDQATYVNDIWVEAFTEHLSVDKGVMENQPHRYFIKGWGWKFEQLFNWLVHKHNY